MKRGQLSEWVTHRVAFSALDSCMQQVSQFADVAWDREKGASDTVDNVKLIEFGDMVR